MPSQDSVRVYGAAQGQPGIKVIERSGANVLSDPRYGSILQMGVLKRGPMGVVIPFSSYSQYQSFCGDPRDASWHLYADSRHMMPDAVEGFYSVGRGKGQLSALRIALDDAKRSEIRLKNPAGAEVVSIKAANEGRWGGRQRAIPVKPLIYATARTFTIHAPGTKTNEFVDALARFRNGSGREYVVTANTKANSAGEVIFTIGAQYNLVLDGISGPTALTGTANYQRYYELAGNVNFDMTKATTGVTTINGRVLTGVGTAYQAELTVGGNIYVNGEPRTIESISSATTATVANEFSFQILNNAPVLVDNKTVVGIGTSFLDPVDGVVPGGTVYALINGVRQLRQVASVASNASLELVSGFTEALVSVKLARDNYVITGLLSSFVAELQAGVSYIIDPNRATNAARVLSIQSATSITIEAPFLSDFTAAQLTKQSLAVEIELQQEGTNGLAIQVGQGTKFPATHFSLDVFFNGSRVYGVSDASLDPSDPLFLENLINEDGENIVYRTGSTNYQRWITADVLWDSAYTTGAGADVRPINGGGKVLAVEEQRLYSATVMDYKATIGQLLYPDPYLLPRGYVRVLNAVAPVEIQGTITTLGNTVTGTATVFRDQFKLNEYIHNPATGETRKIVGLPSQTAAVLDSPFTANLLVAKVVKPGYFEISRGYNLKERTAVGKYFSISFPQFLSGGHDGNETAVSSYNWTRYVDVDTNVIENAIWGKDLGLLRFSTPGVTDVSVQKACADYATVKAFEYAGEIPSNYTTAATAEAFLNQQLGRNDFQSLTFPSYGYIASPFGTGDRLVPLSGDIMGGESARAVDGSGYHKVFAGTEAIMARIRKLPIDVSPQDEALLNLTGIRPVKFMYGNCVVFGARNTAISSLYDFLHIRRIQSNYVRVFLENRNLLSTLFKPNQPELLDDLIMILDNWSRKEYRKGVFTQYLNFKQAVEIRSTDVGSGVVNDAATASGLVSIINGELQIYISYVPTGIVEVLSLNIGPNIVASNYGAALQSSL